MRGRPRRPLVTGLIVTVLVLIGAGFALRLHRARAPTRWSGAAATPTRRPSATTQRFGDDAVIVLVRGDLRQARADRRPGASHRAGGLHLAARARRRDPARRRSGPCAQLRANPRPVKVVYGPGTFINESVGQIADAVHAQLQREAPQAQRPRRRLQARARRRATRSRRRPRQLGKQAELAGLHAVRSATPLQLGLQLRADRHPAVNDPNFVSKLVFEATQARGDAEGALRLPVPDATTRR